MKDLKAAIEAVLEKQGVQASDLLELVLDSKCQSKTITDLNHFSLPNLQSLSLANTGVVTLEGFPALASLTKLVLADNRVSGGLEHLTSLGSLRVLDLAGNRIARLDDLSPLKQLRVESLDLCSCPIEKLGNYREAVFEMLHDLKFLDSIDREGHDRDADEEEEDFEGEGEEDEGEEGGDDGGDDGDAGEGEEGGDDEGDEDDDFDGEDEEDDEVGVEKLMGPPLPNDDPEEEDYEEEEEPDDDDVDDDGEGEDDEDEAGPSTGGTKRKRAEEEEEEDDEDDEDDDE